MPLALGKGNFPMMCQWYNPRYTPVGVNTANRFWQEMSQHAFQNFPTLNWEMPETFINKNLIHFSKKINLVFYIL